MDGDEAFQLIAKAVDAGRLPGGYLIVGDLTGAAIPLAERILAKLFPDETEYSQAVAHMHPDVVWLEPRGKSRTIKVECSKSDGGPGMRDGFIEPMAASAFSGGWKVGIVVGADRMQEAAANAFLKSLEEPPPQTLYLLLTDAPDEVMLTIVSRTQRIDLPHGRGVLDPEMLTAIAAEFSAGDLSGVWARARTARNLADMLVGLLDAAPDTEVPLLRKAFFQALLAVVRKSLDDGRMERYRVFRNLEAVEDAYRQCERFLSPASVLALMMDRMAFPK